MCGADCALQQTLQTSRPIIGKSGYIIDADGDRIPISVSTAVLRDAGDQVIGGAETFRDLTEVEALRRELEGKFRIGDLASRSSLMQTVFEVLPAIAASPSTVLILGDTGTGKELVARTIHSLSPVHQGPFVAVNCGALPDTLLELELFGYKAGAFTRAGKDKPGRFALANGGTFIMCNEGTIRIAHLPEDLTARNLSTSADSDVRSAHDLLDVQSICSALERHGYSRLKAAKDLGIHKTTLFRKMKKLSISLPEQDGRSRLSAVVIALSHHSPMSLVAQRLL